MEGRQLSRRGVGRVMPAFRLRTKVALAALVLLLIPWVGYTYVRAMERLLRESQEQQVIATARAIATALQDRPRLLELRGPQPASSATEEVGLILTGLARPGLRIWVVDSNLRLVAVAGSLDAPPPTVNDETTFGPLERLVLAALRPVFARMLAPPASPVEEFIPENIVLGGSDVERALDGTPAWRRRPTPGGRSAIISAAHPVWVGETVIGAVVLEENTDAIVTFRNRALERLVAVTLLSFAAAALVLLVFASRLSSRLKRLRDEAENAIDSRGRVHALLAGEHASDEIGDLSRSFSTVLARLGDYNAYLESLAGRLSHELRTPIAIVRSSLDNLGLKHSEQERDLYRERAERGLRRLETILTRMSEATRLEQIVREDEREPFDACEVLAGCVSGYRAAYPAHRFELKVPAAPVTLSGSPDLFAQMLDKLAANAADFATGEGPIAIGLAVAGRTAVLSCVNCGPPLPAAVEGRLFESMVSARKGRGDEPHLGLGLYIVRLIAEFHGGQARAGNLTDESGVRFEVALPLAS